VFVGVVHRAGPFQDLGPGPGIATVQFEVRKAYKGAAGRVKSIAFLYDSCAEREFEIGQEYLVYADSEGKVGWCNRSSPLKGNERDQGELAKMSADPKLFSVFGYLWADPTKPGEASFDVSISDGERWSAIPLSEHLSFAAQYRKPASLTVRVTAPYRASFELSEWPTFWEPDVKDTQSGSVLTYKLDYVAGTCATRRIQVSRKEQP
jgi:hypothetical protein